MFATQQYMEMTPDPARKRIREEDEELGVVSSFGEHRNKRLQCLPLRTSPQASQQTLPHSLTPIHSAEESHAKSHFSPWSSQQQDAEMEMMDTVASPPPLAHSQLDAVRFHSDPEGSQSNGRMPTPIQPSFAAQVRGQQCEWAGPGPAVSPNGIVNLGHHVTGLVDQQNIPRTMNGEADWQSVQNNRRLPSPISEAEDPISNVYPDHAADANMQHQLSSQLENSSLSSEPCAQHAMEHPNAMMDIEAMHAAHSRDGAESEGDAASPSPRRIGHMRSKHTINNWTWQPGMKKSFSIGYRADCEKCRLKVPGHFNHIIIS